MTDSDIIKLILQGHKEKFRILVDQYQQMVFRTCIGFLHNDDDAEDLTQDIFIQVYKSLHRFKGEAAFSTWIYRIAINAALNRVRKNSQIPLHIRLSLFFDSGKEREISLPVYDAEDPESILIGQEHRKWVQNALDGLPENQRTAIVLSKYDDFSQKEIAEIIGTTEGAVESLIQRAKINLRIYLSYSYKKYRKTP